MKRPTFFLSSTIFDFSDLRSAIKYELEQRGCLVLASEFNDFRKPLDTHSYEACLNSIEQADYFVLLIGRRVGGWFDPASRVSITQQEYRTAYRLHQAGRLRIISLVRRDVWNFCENHKAFERHLHSLELEGDAASIIARYPTKFAEDAAFIIDFIEEVGRNQQTKDALKSEGPLPTGNWIHVFDGFRDIADVLNSVLLGGLPVDEAVFRRALRHELVELLGKCLLKANGRTSGPRYHVEKFCEAFTLYKQLRGMPKVEVPTAEWDRFASVMIGFLGRRLRVFLLPQALASSTFVEFDPVTSVCRETPVFDALHRLGEEVRAANQALEENVHSVIYAFSPKARDGHNPPTLEIPPMDIARLISLAFRWVNIVELCRAVIAYLEGEVYLQPDLMPWSPVKDFDAQIAAEQATVDEVLAFVKGSARRTPSASP